MTSLRCRNKNRWGRTCVRPHLQRNLNLLFCGLVALGALCAAAIMLVDGKSAAARLPLVALVIFGAAWSWFLRLLIFKVKKNG